MTHDDKIQKTALIYCSNLNFIPISCSIFVLSRKDRSAGSGTLFWLELFTYYVNIFKNNTNDDIKDDADDDDETLKRLL